MNSRFSFRRVALLAQKNYSDNRRNYRTALLLLLVWYACSLYIALSGEKFDLFGFEIFLECAAFVVPIWVARLSFGIVNTPKDDFLSTTLPATRAEKFTFGLLNVVLLTALSIGVMEITASILRDGVDVAVLEDYNSFAGTWFKGFYAYTEVGLFSIAFSMIAAQSRRLGFAKSYIIAAACYILLQLIPVAITEFAPDITSVVYNFPFFSGKIGSSICVDGLRLEFCTLSRVPYADWHILPVVGILLVASWYLFRDKNQK